MGQLRSGLRAYALDGMAPGEVPRTLNRLLRQLEPGRTATLVYLVLDPHGGRLTVAAAGHPPPLVRLRRRRRPLRRACPSSVPLGAVAPRALRRAGARARRRARRSCSTRTVSWSAPGESLDTGLERLRSRTVSAATRTSSSSATAHRRRAAARGAGRRRRRAAAWCARCRSSESCWREFPAEVESIPVMRRLLGRWLDEAGATAAGDRRPDARLRRGGGERDRARVRTRAGRGRAARVGLEATGTVTVARARLRELAPAARQRTAAAGCC